jgi:hypothetical protein
MPCHPVVIFEHESVFAGLDEAETITPGFVNRGSSKMPDFGAGSIL